MKIRNVAGVLIALFSLTTFVAHSTQRSAASPGQPEPVGYTEPTLSPQSPFPDVSIAGLPNKDCCIWQIQRRVDGMRQAKYGNPYNCDTGQTRRGEMTIKMNLKFTGSACDQQDIPPNNCVLEAKGEVIRRNDQYAYFAGEFTISDAAGKALFKGHIETTDRFGTHQLFTNCERCNPPSHFEGWLVGRGTDAFPNHTLRAIIVSRGTVPSPTTTSTPMTGSLTGTLIKCP
jgi:hypothetical protein